MWKSCMVAAQLFLMAHGSPSECQIDRICVCGECVVCVHDKGRKRVRDKWGGPSKREMTRPIGMKQKKKQNSDKCDCNCVVLQPYGYIPVGLPFITLLYGRMRYLLISFIIVRRRKKKWRMLHGMNTLLRWKMPSVAADQSRCRDNRMANWPALPRMAISISMPAIQNINTIYLMSAQNITPDICNWFQ